MSAQHTPIGMDLSDAAMLRNNIVDQCMERLQHFAFRAFSAYGLGVNDFVVICIVVDSRWRDLVNLLMPNATDAHWQAFRDRGELPVARGIALAGAIDLILERLPDLRPAFEESYPEGTARCVALDDSGGTVYQIVARAEPTLLS
jgi:hypothetical protein